MDQPSSHKSSSAYEDLQHNNPWWYSRPMAIVIAGLIVLGTLYLFWRLMISHTEELGEENLPLITAESTPLTLPPSDDDRMQNAPTDKAVYELISDTKKSVAPQLKSSVEEPILLTPPSNSPLDMTPSATDSVQEPLPSSPTTSPPGHLYTVQMASLPSQILVSAEQKKIERKYGEILRGVPGEIVEKVIKDKGTFFRLSYGSFSSKADADALCQKLKEQGASCLVTRRPT